MGDIFAHSAALFEGSLFLVSVAAGVLGAMLGLGGGVLIVPALTLLFGVQIRYAVGASIVSVIATSSGAAAVYVRDHITNIRVAMLLEVATTLGALSGAFLAGLIPSNYLFLIFALILIYSAVVMFRKKKSGAKVNLENDWWAKKLRLNSDYPDPFLGKDVVYGVTGVPLGFSLMYGAGIISGLLGIGSGALKVPAMDSVMKLPIKVSSATSNFMIGVTAAASAGAYYVRGDIVPVLVAPVALGVLLGSFFGTRLMMRISGQKLRVLFVCVLVVIAFQMALKSFGIEVR